MKLVDEQRLGFLSAPAGSADGMDLIDALQEAGLQGRGGSGFPTHVKWRSVASASGATVVVVNGHEGEPASAKDRWLLTHRPFLVLDGLLLAARAVRAGRAVICVSRDDTETSMRHAVAQVEAAGLVPEGARLEVFRTDHRYVSGEESAIVRAINGGPGLPTAKPPRPFEKGVDDLPTLIQNVETLAHVAWIHRHSAAEFRQAGTPSSAGTGLFTVLDQDGGCALLEAPLGTRLVEVLRLAGVEPHTVSRLLLGGWFGGIHGREVLDLEACFTALKAAGSGLGCASISVIGHDDDARATVSELGTWYAKETAGQCGVCRNGTRGIAAVLARNAAESATNGDLEDLARWGASLTGRGACAFLDGAATLARTAVGVVGAPTYAEPIQDDNPAVVAASR